jgi:hypothetical protein
MENTTTANRKGFLQNDRRLVCGMLVFYGLCCIGLFGGGFWWLNQRSQTLLANATSTAMAAATQQANATATVIVHTTEQAQFEYVDHFEDNSGRWRIEKFKNSSRWDGSLEIKEGVYAWQVDQVKRPFIHQVNYFREYPVEDFDAYLDTRFPEEESGDVCGGLAFHKSFKGWEQGAYIFVICNDSTFLVAYYGKGAWETMTDRSFSAAVLPSDWNRIEINARKDHYDFSINNMTVYELTDDRQLEGSLSIVMQVCDTTPTMLWFDNFGYQSR